MAKAPKKKKPEQVEGDDDAQSLEKRSKSSKKLLLAAAAMSMLSLGGGFFLARMAYLQDASTYEVDYVDEEGADHANKGEAGHETDGHDTADAGHGVVDPLAKDGHPAEEAVALKDGDSHGGKEGEPLPDTGLWDFGDLMTNIQGFDVQGAPTKAFLKLSLVMVYRTEEGAADQIGAREPFMRDLFNGYLRGITEHDVRGMAGVLHLKAELLKRARAGMGNDLPREILISDLIVQ